MRELEAVVVKSLSARGGATAMSVASGNLAHVIRLPLLRRRAGPRHIRLKVQSEIWPFYRVKKGSKI